jgi:hypothetical protein
VKNCISEYNDTAKSFSPISKTRQQFGEDSNQKINFGGAELMQINF